MNPNVDHDESKLASSSGEPLYAFFANEGAISNPPIAVGHSIMLRSAIDENFCIDATILSANNDTFTARIEGFDSAEQDTHNGMEIGHTITLNRRNIYSYSKDC